MRTKFGFSIGLLGLLCLMMPGSLRADAFTNGSFESLTYVSPNGPGTIVMAGNDYITGWAVDTFGVVVESSFWQNSNGARSIQLSYSNGGGSPGSIQQTFDTVAGTTYTVLFDMAGNPGNGFPGTYQGIATGIEVSAGNDLADYGSFNTTGKSYANMGWVTESFTFTAVDASTTLKFGEVSLTPSNAVLDNVRVSAEGSPVPEPSTALLMGAGLLGLIGMRASRRRSAA